VGERFGSRQTSSQARVWIIACVLASHTALFQRAVIDVLPDVSTHRLTRLFAEEDLGAVMTRFTLTLRLPVVF
jgi:hypothetical protein